jgi:hypothetical protein
MADSAVITKQLIYHMAGKFKITGEGERDLTDLF